MHLFSELVEYKCQINHFQLKVVLLFILYKRPLLISPFILQFPVI